MFDSRELARRGVVDGCVEEVERPGGERVRDPTEDPRDEVLVGRVAEIPDRRCVRGDPEPWNHTREEHNTVSDQ